MGVACSPDIANLYGAHFEELAFDNDPTLRANVPFYGRFIDDVLGVVYASSSTEALAIMQRVTYHGVELTWEVSEWNTPFLDMLVFIWPSTRQLGWKPYRKARNHLERIPWDSHHPIDVKRGTFIGEMSRLATLCSEVTLYKEALSDLCRLYIARGYPVDLVYKWRKDHVSARWADRLKDQVTRNAEVFVLKTRFNPVWAKFNVHDLGLTVINTWQTELRKLRARNPELTDLGNSSPVARLVDSGASRLRYAQATLEVHRVLDVGSIGFYDRKWLVSRRRNTSLGDLTNVWKKAVLDNSEAVEGFDYENVDEMWN